MVIKRFVSGNLESNGYIIFQKGGQNCYIIDPGYNPKKFIEYIRESELNPQGILITHGHYDHTGAAEGISAEFDTPVYIHELDAFELDLPNLRTMKDGDTFDLDGETLEIISTPGHTHGSVCIMSKKSRACFTGDTLFDTDLGRNDFDGGSEKEMKASIINIIDKWENDITIYPGHDTGCTMKKVRIYNKEFNAILNERRN